MGGNAIQNARRLNKEEYFAMCSEVSQLLTPLLRMHNLRFKIVDAYREKESFGDMDVVIESKHLTIEDWQLMIAMMFNSKEIVHTKNSPVISFEYKEFQIDFIFHNSEDYNFAINYYSYNDVCNLIGRVADNLGFKFGHDGVFYKAMKGTQLLAEICLTKDFQEGLEVFGYSYERFRQGFNNLTEIFEYVANNKFFNKDIFLFENRNHTGRTRDKKRKTYTEFLKYCADTNFVNHYDYSSPNANFRVIARHFPDLLKELNFLEWKENLKSSVRIKLPSDVIKKHCGLDGPAFGDYLSATMDTFNSPAHFWVYVYYSDVDEILSLMDKNFKKTTCVPL